MRQFKMQHTLMSQNGETQSIELADTVFACSFNEPLVHQVFCAYAAGDRQGTHAQKTRAEVSGGGKKPWKQKGTGRARAGSIRSPLWRGGGATFAVKPRDYTQKVNRKMYRGAMRSVFSGLIQEERLVIIDQITLDTSKTKILIDKLSALNAKKAMIIVDEIDKNLSLAARNVPCVKLCLSQEIDLRDLIKYPKTVITSAAVKRIENNLL